MKKFCTTCKHLKIENIPDTPCVEHYCTYDGEVDYVYGFISYPKCINVRKSDNSDCPNWEQGGIKGFFQRLLKKLNLN